MNVLALCMSDQKKHTFNSSQIQLMWPLYHSFVCDSGRQNKSHIDQLRNRVMAKGTRARFSCRDTLAKLYSNRIWSVANQRKKLVLSWKSYSNSSKRRKQRSMPSRVILQMMRGDWRYASSGNLEKARSFVARIYTPKWGTRHQ